MASSLRIGPPFRHGLQYLPIKRSRNLATPRIAHSIASNISRNGSGLPFQPSALKINYIQKTAKAAQRQLQLRAYSHSTPLKTPTADNLIEELEELYVIAKDLFETASNSTGKQAIFAASDRESLRDALDQLVTVYELYTTGEKGTEMSGGDGATEAGLPGPIVRTNFDAGSISDTMMGDVEKRFGQKVFDLRNAVEALEMKARED
ncbi:hypothetical protein N7537_005115 [Penicillium hordei]|uniref:Uncharacterized protein n=1 Tax=Penicillium hordei TaxID=40994 RepID=A0AAD6ECV1_9EURO|nr:uncharacterized protein N7537_005115 [Penicillium hordei]KAJ5608496.1 hypothetical protein N7537_005115 [Penicillium hordei]